jgi:Peptidase family M48
VAVVLRALAVTIVAASCVWSCAAFFTERPFGPFTSVRAPITKFSDFITGLPSCEAVGPVGLLDNGSAFYLSDWCTGTTYRYAVHPSSPTASALNGLTNGLALDRGAYYGIAGRHQAIALPGIYAFDPVTLELDREVAPAPCSDTRGLAADPATGDLYVTGDCGLWRISAVDTPHPLVAHLVTSDFDGIAFTPDGSTMWVANVTHTGVDELSPAGTLLAAVPIPQGAVGVALVSPATHSRVAGDLFVSNDDGSIVMVNTHDHDAVSVVAAGGYRNDYLTIGPDGYLYDAKIDRVEQLQPAIFGPVTPTAPTRSRPRAAGSAGASATSGPAPPGWALLLTAVIAAGALAPFLVRRRGRLRRTDAADPDPALIRSTAPVTGLPDRPPAADAALDRLRRTLTDPDLLPSGTSLRFAVLVLAIVASTGSVYAHLSVIARPAADAAARRCLAAGPSSVDATPTITANPFGCVDRYAPSLALWSAVGITLVLLASALVYALTPWGIRNLSRPGTPFYRDARTRRWVARRPWWIPGGRSQRLPELNRTDALQGAIACRLGQLSGRIGLKQAPAGLLNVNADDTDARAFGGRRRSFVLLHLGLLAQFRTDRPAFDATILHELAHLRNSDSRSTYATLAAWRVFVVLVLVPYVISLIAPGVIRDPFRASAYRLASSTPDPRIGAAILTLTALVFLASRAVMRAREAHADCTAALYDGGALRTAISAAAESPGRFDRADFTRYHPGWGRRLQDLDTPARLIAAGTLTMFTLGVGTSLLVVNTGFNVALGALDSWLTPATIASLERALAADNRSALLGFQLLLYAPSTLLLLAVLVGFCCLAGWRTFACDRAAAGMGVPGDATGRRRVIRAILRDALPLVAGLMIGEPLSAIYADAGTWGVFDTSARRDLVDVATSAVALTVIVCLILVWARESAAARIPGTRRSLRSRCVTAIVVAIIGAAPAAFTWIVAHNNVGITSVSFPPAAAAISTWFGAHWANADYYPLNFLTALPGAGLLFAVPGLYLAVAAVTGGRHERPPTDAPRPGRLADALPVATTVGLSAAVISEVACLVLAFAARYFLGGTALRAAFNAGQNAPYLPIAWMSWTIVTTCALATVVVVRITRSYSATTALLTSFIISASAAFLVLPALFFSYCGTAAYSCATQEPHDLLAAYGLLAAFTTVYAAIATVVTLALTFAVVGTTRPRTGADGTAGGRPPRRSGTPTSGAGGRLRRPVRVGVRVVVVLVLMANAVAGVYVFYTSVFTW